MAQGPELRELLRGLTGGPPQARCGNLCARSERQVGRRTPPRAHMPWAVFCNRGSFTWRHTRASSTRTARERSRDILQAGPVRQAGRSAATVSTDPKSKAIEADAVQQKTARVPATANAQARGG